MADAPSIRKTDINVVEISGLVGSAIVVDGAAATLSADQVREVATGYKPELHEAPLVIGPVTHDAPAFGWVQWLTFDGVILRAYAEETEGAREFMSLIAKGKRVSANFYTPTAPGNPVPGQYSLRHVSIEGVPTPTVLAGLTPVNFAASEEGVVTFGDVAVPGVSELSNSQLADLALDYQAQLAKIGRSVGIAAALDAVRADTGPASFGDSLAGQGGNMSDRQIADRAALHHARSLDAGRSISMSQAIDEVSTRSPLVGRYARSGFG